MGLLEILLILAGITICVISFIIPAKREEQLEETKELAKEEIKELVNQELSHVKEQVEGTVDETITYAVEKTERFMDRMSNEKMMALNEYSDTVMEDIHKSHNEVMFLYDMLNNKHDSIKAAVAEVDKAVKAVAEMPETRENAATVNTAGEASTPASAVKSKPVSVREQTEQRIRDALAGKIPHPLADKAPQPAIDSAVDAKSSRQQETVAEPEKTVEIQQIETAESQQQEIETKQPEVDLSFANMGAENSNEQILRLHKEGKSKVSIAKELGLGVGEVKLVIDLFEGM